MINNILHLKYLTILIKSENMVSWLGVTNTPAYRSGSISNAKPR